MMWRRPPSLVGASRERAGLFTLIAVGLFGTGFLLADLPGRLAAMLVQLGVTLLVLTLVATSVQAYLNGSTAVALLLSAAAPVGFLARTMLVNWRPLHLRMLQLGLALGLLFGVTGHLLGSRVATSRDAPSEPSYRGQIALAALMFVVLGSCVLSPGNI